MQIQNPLFTDVPEKTVLESTDLILIQDVLDGNKLKAVPAEQAITGVTSITGTANQITASAATGDVTLSLASAVTTSLALADSALQNGDNVSELVNDAGYLTSSTGVTSITGTANQITASAATGAVTLSLPSVVDVVSALTAPQINARNATIGDLDGDPEDFLRVQLNSVGFASFEANGDTNNTIGEPGGASYHLTIDGGASSAVVALVNEAGTDGRGNSYTGTISNCMLVGTNGASNSLRFGVAGAVCGGFDAGGNFFTNNITYGTITPTSVSVPANVNAGTIVYRGCKYNRVTNLVTMSGRVSFTTTNGNALSFNFTVPISSNFTSVHDVSGVYTTYIPSDNQDGNITANTTLNTVSININPNGAQALEINFFIQYEIK